jgi:LytS/YehU family sensor histidine kinase
MDQRMLLKLGVNVVASTSVWKIVNDIVKNNVVVITRTDHIKTTIGSFVLGSMIANQAQKHVNENFDQAAAWFDKRKKSENAE